MHSLHLSNFIFRIPRKFFALTSTIHTWQCQALLTVLNPTTEGKVIRGNYLWKGLSPPAFWLVECLIPALDLHLLSPPALGLAESEIPDLNLPTREPEQKLVFY